MEISLLFLGWSKTNKWNSRDFQRNENTVKIHTGFLDPQLVFFPLVSLTIRPCQRSISCVKTRMCETEMYFFHVWKPMATQSVRIYKFSWCPMKNQTHLNCSDTNCSWNITKSTWNDRISWFLSCAAGSWRDHEFSTKMHEISCFFHASWDVMKKPVDSWNAWKRTLRKKILIVILASCCPHLPWFDRSWFAYEAVDPCMSVMNIPYEIDPQNKLVYLCEITDKD